MSLGDHRGTSGDYLQEGNHHVKITKVRLFKYSNGNPGVEFHFRDQLGKTGKYGLSLHENALWKLGNFAIACGLTEDDLKTYNEKSPNSHQRLVEKQVMIRMVRGEKYCNVPDNDGFWKVGDTVPAAAHGYEPTVETTPEPEKAYDGTDDPPEPVEESAPDPTEPPPEDEDIITGEAPW